MKYKVLIYKNNKFLAEKDLKKFEENNYIYKWSNVESGSYFFEIKDENDEVRGVTYTHTAPFATDFEAVVEKDTHPKSITGFQNGIDIILTYLENEQKFLLKKTKFFKMKLDLKEFELEKAEKLAITGSFNGWKIDEEPIRQKSDNIYEITLAIPEGVYEYKYI